jgi:hypothetical protein
MTSQHEPQQPTDAMTIAAATARATTASAVAALVALAALLAALAWPALSTTAMVLLLAVPLVRNVVIVALARGAERWLAATGIVLLVATVLQALR